MLQNEKRGEEMIQIEVNGTKARCVSGGEMLTSGSVGLVVKVAFSSEWRGLIKTAIVCGSGKNLETLVKQKDTFTVPHECMTEVGSEVKIGLYGMRKDGTVVIPTVYCALGTIQEGTVPTGENGEEPTPSVFNQLMAVATEAVDAAQAAQTAAGASAAQAASSVTTATTAADTVQKAQTEAEASAAQAAASATTATTAATSAATSATSASGSATNAKASETAAASSAQKANTAATLAAAYKYDPNTYEGVDLSVQFADEIANYSDAWAWIKARIKAANYTDLHVGDYIPFTTTNGVSLKAQIAGIDTHTNYGDTAVGHHIDFICVELWPTLHVFNKVNFNNGISNGVPYPWLASDLYHYVNSLSGTVPNAAVSGGGDGEAVDYTTDGIYYYLPDALKAVIIQKRMMMSKRYSGSGLLSSDNGWGWVDTGYLWIPTEFEVLGSIIWDTSGYAASGTAVQYPLFAYSMRRVKKCNGSNCRWWLLATWLGASSHFMAVFNNGIIFGDTATSTNVAVPVCFRVG
jgi:hypothetical protein